MDKKILTGIIASLGASLCCITPVLAVLAGSAGLASTFSWLDPFRPYFIGLTVLVLAYVWWEKLKPKEEISCECETQVHTPEQFGQPADLHPDTLPELIRTASRFIFGQF